MSEAEDDLTEILVHIVEIHEMVLLTDLPELIFQYCDEDVKQAIDRVGGLKSLLKRQKHRFVLKGTFPSLFISLAQDAGKTGQEVQPMKVSHSFGSKTSNSQFVAYLKDYCNALGNYLNQNDFYNVSKLLQISNDTKSIDRGFAFLKLKHENKSDLLEKHALQTIPMGFQELVKSHILACTELVSKMRDFVKMFNYQVKILDIYCEKMMQYKEDLLLNTLLVDARVLAFKIDRKTGNKDCSATIISKMRKYDYNHIVMTHLIKTAFNINSVHSILRNIFLNNRFSENDKYGLIAYHYEAGKVLVYRKNYHSAFKFLEWSYKNCPQHLVNHRKSICKYLIPVAATLNKFPICSLLEELELDFLKILLHAVKIGDVSLYRRELNRLSTLLKWDMYRVLMDLDLVLYRNLLKKIIVLQKPKFLKSLTYLRALTINGTHFDEDEVDCILVKLKELNMAKFAMRYKDMEFFAAFSKFSAFPDSSKWYS